MNDAHVYEMQVQMWKPNTWGVTPMVLLGDVGHVQSYFGPFGDSVSVGARLVHGLRQTYHRLLNHFGHIRWYS